MAVEGGFQGRTNKLVDSCYSFWMGGIFPILSAWDDNRTPYMHNSLLNGFCSENNRNGRGRPLPV